MHNQENFLLYRYFWANKPFRTSREKVHIKSFKEQYKFLGAVDFVPSSSIE